MHLIGREGWGKKGWREGTLEVMGWLVLPSQNKVPVFSIKFDSVLPSIIFQKILHAI